MHSKDKAMADTGYTRELIERYAHPVPRYTSYPTAPHFSEAIKASTVTDWLSETDEAAISLYIHIPYCDRLCWFCACHTQHTLKYEPIQRYIGDLCKEVAIVAEKVGSRRQISQLHLGGGSPSLLKAQELIRLREALDTYFIIDDDTEISIEFDPSDLSADALAAFKDFRLTRASLGVQDFAPRVQEYINRPQSYRETADCIDGFRALGINSINIDALYGLPGQTLDTLEATLDYVCGLEPDRIALFGYAHVPWAKPHQRMIANDTLPDVHARFWQAQYARQIIGEYGYNPLGIDHFVRPGDSLDLAYSLGRAKRNFQGYTTDTSPTLIGLGVSSISRYNQGYAQNTKSVHEWRRCLDRGELAIERGIKTSGLNMAWGAAIESLMTYFSIDSQALRQAHGAQADAVLAKASLIAATDLDEFFVQTRRGYRITPAGRPFTRTLASRFDPFLSDRETRFSIAV
jgi:oxygen-independent coproporphyrinogen-3 oxidase